MGEPAKVWKELEFITEACYTCGTLFGLPAQYQRDRRADRKSFYCPNGHSQAYVGKNEADLLKEQLEAAHDKLARVEKLRDKLKSHGYTESRQLWIIDALDKALAEPSEQAACACGYSASEHPSGQSVDCGSIVAPPAPSATRERLIEQIMIMFRCPRDTAWEFADAIIEAARGAK